MVYVEGGTFNMGSENGTDIEKPVHSVTLSSYYIGKYEVTQQQWREIMGKNPSKFSGCDNCPVERVSWNDIKVFIQKLNKKTGKKYRLPTEAEWEYAARGGKKSKSYQYAGSNNVDEVAWHGDNSDGKTHSVGQKKANELGVFDMCGNVWEWCEDWYGGDYYKTCSGKNPAGPTYGSSRIGRGSSWGDNTFYRSISFRYFFYPDFRGITFGFRLCQSQ